jgi:hypothetical protein
MRSKNLGSLRRKICMNIAGLDPLFNSITMQIAQGNRHLGVLRFRFKYSPDDPRYCQWESAGGNVYYLDPRTGKTFKTSMGPKTSKISRGKARCNATK